MSRALWPPEGDDEFLLAGESWGPLFDRWTYTTMCFVHRILYDMPAFKQYTAHRLLLLAAAGGPGSEPFERAVCNEIRCFIAEHIVEFTAHRAQDDARLRASAKALKSVCDADRVVAALYDYETKAGSRHDLGVFRAEDVARLFDKSVEAIHVRAHRVKAALREARGRYE